MIVRNYDDAKNTKRKINDPNNNWNSVRLLLKEDNVGFSFHITTIYIGAEIEMHYTNHFESVYCISGIGEIETLSDNKKFDIAEGTIYVLDQNDRHVLRAFSELKLACVFNPPLIGNEVHNENGSYNIIQ